MSANFKVRTTASARGNITYSVELTHRGLHKHRSIRGPDEDIVKRKAELQRAQWKEQWSTKQAKDAKAKSRTRSQGKAEAATAEAQTLLDRVRHTLQHTLGHDDAVDWNLLKDRTPFAKPKPRRANPKPPAPAEAPPEPLQASPHYLPALGILDLIFPSRATRRRRAAAERFNSDHAQWERRQETIALSNSKKEQTHAASLVRAEEAYKKALDHWKAARAIYKSQQEQENAPIDTQRRRWKSGDPDAIAGYCDMVLSRSDYPECFPKEFDLEYNPDTRMLIAEYVLPAPDAIPTLTEVKYVASKDEFQEKHLSAAQVGKLYDDVLYQLTLRTVHEVFEADTIQAIDAVVFNGHVTSIDKVTGNETTACVLSLQAKRDEFMAINLAQVDPKACFRQLKGVGSSKLHSVAPIAPILQIRREDSRFVAEQDVAHQLDEGYNLAAMDWEDFEHLIREVFGQEFSDAGGEVKITRASRDRGVDAIAFDPDPIRGGKIVIQAKRYIATVDVAAVRDLFGTVMNEGASKGILVTTSDFGPDAYKFASDKPLTLLNGANLLHLLEKHGHKAKIDLQEARKLALEQGRED